MSTGAVLLVVALQWVITGAMVASFESRDQPREPSRPLRERHLVLYALLALVAWPVIKLGLYVGAVWLIVRLFS